jgi:acetyltransferase
MNRTPRRARFEIRPVDPSDCDALMGFYAGLSEDSREARFHGRGPSLAGSTATFFCGPDHQHREGLVAEVVGPDDGREIIGHADLEPAGPGTAEIAVAVADAWQRHGVGRALARASIDWARRCGFERLVASMQIANPAIAGLVRSLGVPVRFGMPDGGVVDAVIELGAIRPRAA